MTFLVIFGLLLMAMVKVTACVLYQLILLEMQVGMIVLKLLKKAAIGGLWKNNLSFHKISIFQVKHQITTETSLCWKWPPAAALCQDLAWPWA